MELKGIISPKKTWEEGCFTALVYEEEGKELDKGYFISINEDMLPQGAGVSSYIILSTTDEQVDGCRLMPTPPTTGPSDFDDDVLYDDEEWDDEEPFEKF